MSVASIQKSQITFRDEVVTPLLNKASIDVMQNMVKALMNGLQHKITFKELAAERINPNLDSELSKSNNKIKVLCGKLFELTEKAITNHSKQVLVPALAAIRISTKDEDSSRKFIGSFVLPETFSIMQKIQEQYKAKRMNKKDWNTWRKQVTNQQIKEMFPESEGHPATLGFYKAAIRYVKFEELFNEKSLSLTNRDPLQFQEFMKLNKAQKACFGTELHFQVKEFQDVIKVVKEKKEEVLKAFPNL